MTNWWNQIGKHSMTHVVLPQDRCKPVFPNMQTFAGKQDIKWPPKQHSGQFNKWQYHPWWQHQDLQWLGGWSQIPFRNAQQKGTISYSPMQEKHQQPTCWEFITHATAKALDIQVTSTFKPCEDCALGKSKQQAVNKRLFLVRKCWDRGFSLT